MLDIYTGAPGSGKSLDMARVILRKISAGRKVICNTEIVLPETLAKFQKNLFCIENKDITPQFLWEFAERNHEPRRESQTTVIIDECQLKFCQLAMKNKDMALLWLELFSQHRKIGFDFLLITPDARSGIIKEIRNNFESEVAHLKLSNYPTKSLFLMVILLIIQLSPIEIFMRVIRWRGLPDKKYLVRHLFLYSPKYASIYDTYKIQESSFRKPKPPDEPPPVVPVVIDAELLKPPESITWS